MINYAQMKNEGLLDYISNHYEDLSKSDLADMARELDYAICEKLGEELEEICVDTMIETLTEEYL